MAKIKSLLLESGDVLLTEGGDRDKLGRGWVWHGQLPECIHQNHIFRARLDLDRFVPEFISIYANNFGQEWFERMGKQTTNLASISLTNLRRFPVPTPPLVEQQRVIAEVDRQFSIIDAMGKTIDDGLRRASTLRQSIFSQAFSGTLTGAA